MHRPKTPAIGEGNRLRRKRFLRGAGSFGEAGRTPLRSHPFRDILREMSGLVEQGAAITPLKVVSEEAIRGGVRMNPPEIGLGDS